MDFYVYVYLDPRKEGCFKYGKDGEFEFDYEPFYVGKGKGKRKDCHIRECNIRQDRNKYKNNKINKLKRLGLLPIVIVIKDKMEESGAFQLEKDIIKAIGRVDKKLGPLTNMTDGGEGASGAILSEERKEKLRQKHLGMKASEETRKKMSNFQLQRYKNMSEEEKKKYSDKMKSMWTNEMKDDRRNMYIGDKNPNFGNKWSSEQKKKLSDHQKKYSLFVTNNPQKINPRSGKESCGIYMYAVYELDGKLIIKTDKIYEIIKRFDMAEQTIRKISKTSHMYNGKYIDRVLLENEDSMKDVITDKKILSKMKDYETRYKIGKKIGLDRTLTQYYEFKVYKDGEFIFKTYNPKDIADKYGRRVLRRFHETPSGKEGKIDEYIIQRDKLSEDFLNG